MDFSSLDLDEILAPPRPPSPKSARFKRARPSKRIWRTLQRVQLLNETLEHPPLKRAQPLSGEGHKQDLRAAPGWTRWIWETDAYRQWENTSGVQVLWITGSPDSGKSLITSDLLESRLRPRAAQDTNTFICEFSFNSNSQGEQSSNNGSVAMAFNSITEQLLLSRREQGLDPRQQVVDSNMTNLRLALDEATWSTIVFVFSGVEARLAEDEETLTHLLATICGTIKGRPSVKLLLTSRPSLQLEKRVPAHIKGRHDIQLQYLMIVSLRHYIVSRFEHLKADFGWNPGFDEAAFASEALCMSTGSFKRASEIMDRVELLIGDTEDYADMIIALEDLRGSVHDLGNFYDTIIERVGGQRDVADFLVPLVIATRPLTQEELVIAATTGLRTDKTQARLFAQRAFETGLLVKLDREGLDFFHSSLKKRIMKTWSAKREGSSIRNDPHYYMGAVCLKFLGIVAAASSGSPESEVEVEVESRSFYTYAAVNWVAHIRQTPSILLVAKRTIGLTIRLLCGPKYSWVWLPQYWEKLYPPAPKPFSNFTVLETASLLGFAWLVSELLPEDIPAANVTDQQIPLHLAAMSGHNTVVELFLATKRSKTYVNIPDSHGQTPLHHAVRYRRHGVIAALLSAGANVGYQDRDGQTPVHIAAIWGDEDVMGRLLKENPVLDILDNNHDAPLDSAKKARDNAKEDKTERNIRVAVHELLEAAEFSATRSQTHLTPKQLMSTSSSMWRK
ncbi:hypothetical protein OQA88_5143 [Cercophora sp. LCS_1]